MPMQCYVYLWEVSRKKKTFFHWEISVSCILPGNTRVKAFCYPISSLLSVSGRLREVKNKRKFQTFSSKSGRGRLREVVSCKRFPMQWFGRKTFSILLNWSLRRGGRNQRLDCSLIPFIDVSLFINKIIEYFVFLWWEQFAHYYPWRLVS